MTKPGPKPQAELLQQEIYLAQKIGIYQASKWKLVDPDDCVQHLGLILTQKWHSGVLQRYREAEGGMFALAELLRKEAHLFCTKEQVAAQSAPLLEDQTKYTYQEIKNTLPHIFNLNEYQQTTYMDDSEVKSGSIHNTQNQYEEVINIINEVSQVYQKLPKEEKNLIDLVYKEDLPETEVANLLNTTPNAIYKKISRIIKKIQNQI